MSKAIPPIDQLVLKGTHNSYDQWRKVTVEEQVENYGVWVVELDYSVMWADLRQLIEVWYGQHDARFATPPPCVIGHDGPGICADDAGAVFSGGPDYLLKDALRRLAQTEASQYRPLVIYLDKKDFPFADPKYDDPENLYPLVAGELRSVFGGGLVSRAELSAFHSQAGRLPTARELRGRVIAISTAEVTDSPDIFHEPSSSPGEPAPPGETDLPTDVIFTKLYTEGCSRPDDLPALPTAPPQVYRFDNFTDSWTWDYAAPSNPLVVDPTPSAVQIVGCSEDPDELIHQSGAWHGTRLMPYPTIAAAAARARGSLDSGAQGGISQRGYGFTVLARPGSYGEPLLVDFPLMISPLPESTQP